MTRPDDDAEWEDKEGAHAIWIARYIQAGSPDRTRDADGKDLENVIRNDEICDMLWNAALEYSGACALCGKTAFVEVELPFDGTSRWNCRDLSACFGSSFDGMHFVWTGAPPAGIVPGTWICDDELTKLILSGAVEVARAIYNEAFREADARLAFDEGE